MRSILSGLILVTTGGLLCGAETPPALPDSEKVYSQEEALKIGWPQLMGPLGTNVSLQINTPLIADLSQAKVLWESECKDFGGGKGGSQAFNHTSQFATDFIDKKMKAPGNWAGPIVAEGLVLCSSWRLCGEEKLVKGSVAPARGGPKDDGDDKADASVKTDGTSQEMKVRLDAEDTLTAIDALTGKTRWQAVEPGGLLCSGGKRMGFQVAPVAHKGVVYALGSTARIFAYDIASGKKLWVSDVHPARAARKKAREDALASLDKGIWPKYNKQPGWFGSLLVAQDTLIVPDQRGGLLGVDCATGTQKWAVKDVVTIYGSPSVWRHEGYEYILCANTTGDLRLIDPPSGKELWRLSGLGPNWTTLTPGKTHVLVNVVPGSGKSKGAETKLGRVGSVRLSPTKGEMAWTLDPSVKNSISVSMDLGPSYRFLYRAGRFITFDTPGLSPSLLIDEESGKVLSSFEFTGNRNDSLIGLLYWCGDHVISRGDSVHGPSHGGRHPWSYWTIKNDTITQAPGKMDLGEFSSAYEALMEVPLVGGLMFERCLNGGIICYDLRQK